MSILRPFSTCATSAIPSDVSVRVNTRIWELDGLRGIAVLAVINCHYMGWFPEIGSGYGWLGVDLFFVLSGFLISSILLELRDKERYFTVFYSRRALRIFPPYFLGLFVYLGVSAVFGMLGTVGMWSSYIFYYVSLFIRNPLPPIGNPSGLPMEVAFGMTVLWSLSVEEIYYTVWAPLVRFAKEGQFTAVLFGMIITAPVLRWYLHSPDQYELFTFYCRMDGLAYGSMVALLIRHRKLAPAKWIRFDRVFNWLTVILIPLSILFWLISKGILHEAAVSDIGISLADISFALITHAMVRNAGSDRFWIRIFRVKWLRSIGMVSYSLYLFHYPLLILSKEAIAKMHFARRTGAISEVILGLALSFSVAYGLWYGMESRILRWKDRTFLSPAHPQDAQYAPASSR